MITGIVSKVNVQERQGPRGPYKTYSFALQGQQGWHNLGFEQYGVSEGQSISFEVVKNSRGYDTVAPESIKILEGQVVQSGTAPAAVAATPYVPKRSWGGAAKGNQAKDKYWEDKAVTDVVTQKRIELQSCRNSALQLIDILVKTDSIKWPKAQTDKVSFIEDMLAHYTQQFIAENNGQGKEKPASEPVVEEPKEEVWG